MPSRLRSLLLSALILCTCRAVQAEWQNALKPTGVAAGNFKVAEGGKPLCKIAVSNPSSAVENSAAKELQHWLHEITAATPELAKNPDGPCIVIRTEPALGEEGYRIAVEGDDLILAGGAGRGCMNAVFALLEEDLGCRFYTNESIKLTKTASLTIQPVARQYKPQLRLRDPFYKCAFDAAWSLRNRTNCPEAPVPEEQGGYIDYDGMFVHTAATLVPVDKYFKDHPEYFFLNKSGQRAPQQLCTTDPNVLKIATETVLAQLRKSPHTEIISVSKNDSGGDQLCQCERCKKLRDAEGGAEMACQLVLVNGVAEAVEKEFPDVIIDTLAYLDTIAVPKTMRPRHNVAVRLCNDSIGAWSQPFKPAEQLPVAKIAEAWSAAHNRIYVWDYNVNFSHYLAPMPNLDVIAANIRFWAKNNAEGVMLQGGYQGPADGDELKSWVAAKLMWDPSRDEKALTADFIWGHYGAAAPAMAEYEQLLEGLRTKYPDAFANCGGIRYNVDVGFLTKEFIDQASAQFAKARQAAAGNETLTKRVERAELPILYVKCARGKAFTGNGYVQAVADFERIARREGVTYIAEWTPSFEPTLAAWKKAAAEK